MNSIGLSLVDHIVGFSQVVLSVAASMALLLLRRVAVTLFLVCTLLSALAVVFVREWGVSFLPPFMPGLLCVCAYWLQRRGFLH